MKELKLCPFCGEEPLMFFSDETRFEDDVNGWVVGCITENCPGHIAMSWTFWGFDGREKAISAWNNRVDPKQKHLEAPFAIGDIVEEIGDPVAGRKYEVVREINAFMTLRQTDLGWWRMNRRKDVLARKWRKVVE